MDTIAFQVVTDEISWEAAQRKAAGYSLNRGDYGSFQKYMDNLISQYPVILEYYNTAVNELMKIKRYDEAYKYLI